MESLQQQFPQLFFAEVADKWIRSFRGKDLSEQLRNRRIVKVSTAPLLSSGGLGIRKDGNFFVLLNDMNRPEENAESLGHEIAHTFHQDLTQNPPKDLLPPDLAEITEDFCRTFSEIWLYENGKEKITMCCENQKTLTVHCNSKLL